MDNLYDILKDVPVEGTNVLIARKQGKKISMVTDGLKPKKPPAKEGLHLLSPEELASVYVDKLHVNGRVLGYQRQFDPAHARRIAKRLRNGKPIPTVEIGLDGHNRFYADDGQHRIAGAIMARIPIIAVVQRRDRETRAELFASQKNAKKLDPNHMVMTGTGPYERYVQDAVATDDKNHPWHGFVSPVGTSKTKIGPNQLVQLLIRFVGNAEHRGAQLRFVEERWDATRADDLAPLVRAFGDKGTNPAAFRNPALQAIGATAMHVFRRQESLPSDRDRWISHMVTFPFHKYPHLRYQTDIRDQLIDYWNKGLRGKRRVVKS